MLEASLKHVHRWGWSEEALAAGAKDLVNLCPTLLPPADSFSTRVHKPFECLSLCPLHERKKGCNHVCRERNGHPMSLKSAMYGSAFLSPSVIAASMIEFPTLTLVCADPLSLHPGCLLLQGHSPMLHGIFPRGGIELVEHVQDMFHEEWAKELEGRSSEEVTVSSLALPPSLSPCSQRSTQEHIFSAGSLRLIALCCVLMVTPATQHAFNTTGKLLDALKLRLLKHSDHMGVWPQVCLLLLLPLSSLPSFCLSFAQPFSSSSPHSLTRAPYRPWPCKRCLRMPRQPLPTSRGRVTLHGPLRGTGLSTPAGDHSPSSTAPLVSAPKFFRLTCCVAPILWCGAGCPFRRVLCPQEAWPAETNQPRHC